MATIVFFPEGAYGPTNNCVGIGEVLRERGHRVVFIVEESFAGTLEARGFEERLMRLGPPPEHEEAPGQFWIDFIRDTAPVFRKPTIEQLGEFIAPTFEALCDGARYVDDAPARDHRRAAARRDRRGQRRVVPGARRRAGGAGCGSSRAIRPRCRIRRSPPVFSGYPEADRSEWAAFREEFRRTHADLHASFDEFCRECGAPPLPGLEFMDTSPFLNLYGYPDEADYERARPLGATWHNVQTSVRTSEPWELPEHLRDGAGALLYLSLGSLGSADVGADAAPGRHPRRDRAPRDRLQGPAGRADPRCTTTCAARATCRSRRSCRRSTS